MDTGNFINFKAFTSAFVYVTISNIALLILTFLEGMELMNLTITRASQLHALNMDEIAIIFTSGFESLFRCFKKDNLTLATAFSGAFQAGHIFVAHEGDEILGILGFSDKTGRAMRLRPEDMRKHLGLISGTLIHHTLAGELAKPFDNDGSVCYIDFLITRPQARGQGVGQALLRHCFLTGGNTSFLLQVDTANIPAYSLYEKTGFATIKKERNPYAKQTGIKEWALMRYSP